MPTLTDYTDEMIRVPDILFSATDPHVITRLGRQLIKGEPLSVNLRRWHGKAYVIKLTPRWVDGFNRVDAILRPTGRPYSRFDTLRNRVKLTNPEDQDIKLEATVALVKDIAELRSWPPPPPPPPTKTNERSQKETGAMAPKNTARPKFYVGSQKATQPDYKGETWAKYTEKEAIEHATRIVERTGEAQFIVKIIKVVRRKPQPIVVEAVK